MEYRHVGVRVQMPHGHPCPVVQSSLRIGVRLPACRAQKLHCPACDLRVARCRVGQLIQRWIEPAEVVKGGRPRSAGDARLAGHPVGRNHQHRTRPGQLPTERRQLRPGQTGRQGETDVGRTDRDPAEVPLDRDRHPRGLPIAQARAAEGAVDDRLPCRGVSPPELAGLRPCSHGWPQARRSGSSRQITSKCWHSTGVRSSKVPPSRAHTRSK